jgi:hypothetical protein
MTALKSRLKKAETAASDIVCDNEAYIRANMSYFRGDGGKALALLPPFKGGPQKNAAIIINALSRIDNEDRDKAKS